MTKKLLFLSFVFLLGFLGINLIVPSKAIQANEPEIAAEAKVPSEEGIANPPSEDKPGQEQGTAASKVETPRTERAASNFWDKIFKTGNSNSSPAVRAR